MTFGPPDRDGLTPVAGGVTAARGFRAAGITAGLKSSGRPDLALVAGDTTVTTGVATTTNRVKAAPCLVTERHAADGRARAVVVNSGNANACTGPDGLADAEAIAVAVAKQLSCSPEEVLVLSTGVIGVRLPMPPLLSGLPTVVGALSTDGGEAAAQAIMTTDTTVKQVSYSVDDGTGRCRVGGMAKGAGMIEPSLATMLAVITTDAPLSPAVLRPMVRQAVRRTFNRISVDACGSTNDTVVVLASGAADRPPGLATVQTALEAVCADLARAIVADGEGTTRVAELRVTGARTEEDAVDLARAAASSVLLRAALHGADPNWGRILAAMGASDVDFDPGRVAVTCGGVTVCRFGTATAFDRGMATAALSKPEVAITVDLGLGHAEATFLTADITPAYVTDNARYTT